MEKNLIRAITHALIITQEDLWCDEEKYLQYDTHKEIHKFLIMKLT